MPRAGRERAGRERGRLGAAGGGGRLPGPAAGAGPAGVVAAQLGLVRVCRGLGFFFVV